jgi:transcription antitermination factor NusG
MNNQVEQVFGFKVGDSVVVDWDYLAGQRGKVLKAELKQGYQYYLVALPESETWLAEESLELV